MRVSFAVVMFLISALPMVSAEPAPSCSTILQVNTCGDVPVADRKIKIETRDGEHFKERTDSLGQTSLDICHDEISSVKISGVNNRKISRATSINNTETESHAIITLNICDA